jgi:predicted dehydrogenase
MEKIGIGIIGSRFAADLHAHAFGKLRGVKREILAVCSKTKESAETFAQKFHIPHVYTDQVAGHVLGRRRGLVGRHPDLRGRDKGDGLLDRRESRRREELVTAYLSNSVVQVNINPNTSLQVYAPDGQIWGDEYITEKVETKGGWQFPSPDEDWMRGYPQEMEDFVDAVREGREPLSGLLLAHETVEVICAGYVSAQEGRRVDLVR